MKRNPTSPANMQILLILLYFQVMLFVSYWHQAKVLDSVTISPA